MPRRGRRGAGVGLRGRPVRSTPNLRAGGRGGWDQNNKRIAAIQSDEVNIMPFTTLLSAQIAA